MCYLYSSRFENPRKRSDPLLAELRAELYLEPYEEVDWDGVRHACCPLDEYQHITPLQARPPSGGARAAARRPSAARAG